MNMQFTNYAAKDSVERQLITNLYLKLTSNFHFDVDELPYLNDSDEFNSVGEAMAKLPVFKPSNQLQNLVVVYTDRYADTLGNSFLQSLESQYSHTNNIALTCFWNIISKPDGESNLEHITYPVMKTYKEQFNKDDFSIIMVNPLLNYCDLSIVKTNLTRILTGVIPNEIFIVSPIISNMIFEELKREFPPKIADTIVPISLLTSNDKVNFISKGNGDALTVRARRMNKSGLSSGQ